MKNAEQALNSASSALAAVLKNLEAERDSAVAARDAATSALAAERERSSRLASDLENLDRRARESSAATERASADRSAQREQAMAVHLTAETEQRKLLETRLTQLEAQREAYRSAQAARVRAAENKAASEHKLADDARIALEDTRKMLAQARSRSVAEVDACNKRVADITRTADAVSKQRDSARSLTGSLLEQVKTLKDEVSKLRGDLMAATHKLDQEAGRVPREELERQLAVAQMQLQDIAEKAGRR